MHFPNNQIANIANIALIKILKASVISKSNGVSKTPIPASIMSTIIKNKPTKNSFMLPPFL